MRRRVTLVAAMLLAMSWLTAPTASASIHTVPPAAVTNCATDVTAALQSWINGVPNGAGQHNILLFTPGCYRVDGTLQITNRSWLDFRGGGAVIDQSHVEGGPQRMAWRVAYGNDLRWSGFNVVGPHTQNQTWLGNTTVVSKYGWCASNPAQSCEWQYSWGLFGVTRVTLDNNTTRDTYGDSVAVASDSGFYGFSPGETKASTGVLVSRHSVYGTGRQGISVGNGTDITVRDSYIEGAAASPIDLETEGPVQFPLKTVKITGNRFGQSSNSVVLGSASNTCVEISGVSFTGNEFTAPNTTYLPNLSAAEPVNCAEYRGDYSITNNKFWVGEYADDGDQLGWFDGIIDVTFSGNTAKHTCDDPWGSCQPDEAALKLTSPATGWIIRDNTLPWATVWTLDGVAHGEGKVQNCGNAVG